MAYGDFEDLTRRRASDRILRDKAFNIAKNPKYCGYQHGLASMYKETYGEAATLANKSAIKNEDMSKKELVKITQLLQELLGVLIFLICN